MGSLTLRCAFLTAALLLASTVKSVATSGLTLADAPDVVSGCIDVSYSAASDTLSASGVALDLDDYGVAPSNKHARS